jgi:mannose-6-phosphate isomerase-like protein (cupin superfamily)
MDRLPDEQIAITLSSRASRGDLAVLEVRIPPGGGPPMLHRHDAFELYRVRSGELAIYLEGENGSVARKVVRPGEVMPIGGGLEHTVRNESDEVAEAVVVFSPGEAMERFARAIGDSGPEEVLALAVRHGIEITRSIEDALAESGEVGQAGYLSIARFSGDGDQLLAEYRKTSDVMDGVGRDHGLILHAGAKTDDGLLVVNLWPSQKESEAAARDRRRLEVLERAELDPGEIRREHHEVERFVVFDSA